MGFRYQPIIRRTNANGLQDECVSLAEVYLEDDDTLRSWTECLQVAPVGNDIEDLFGEIANMWISAMCWVPVLEDDLKVGMSFERAVDQKTRNELADFLDRGGNFLHPN